jgi:hypothetical protein
VWRRQVGGVALVKSWQEDLVHHNGTKAFPWRPEDDDAQMGYSDEEPGTRAIGELHGTRGGTTEYRETDMGLTGRREGELITKPTAYTWDSWEPWERRPLEVIFAWPPYMRGPDGEKRIREIKEEHYG